MDAAPAAELNFQDATEDDIDELVALIESAYRGDASRRGWTTEADLLDGQRTDVEAVRTVIMGAESRLLTLRRGDELVACCQLERRTGAGGETAAYLGMFAVRPGIQGNGLGKRVLVEAEHIVRREWGAREMQMTVISARDDLIAWYERRGYRRTGQMSPFPYGDERFGIPLRDDLQFELLVKPLD